MKYTRRILSFLLALCLLVMPLVGCAGHRRPLIYLKSALTRTLGRSTAGEMLSALLGALEEGVIDLSVKGSHTLGGVSALDLSLYLDADDRKVMADTALVLDGKNYDAKLWLSGKDVALSSTAFLGSTTLGLDLNTLQSDIAHSIFKNNSGTDYAVPEINDGTATAIVTLVEGFYTLFGALEDTPDLFDKYVEVFLKCLTEYANITKYKEGGQVKIYLSLDNSMLSRALRDTWERAAKDKTLSARVKEVAKTRDAMQSALDGVVSTVWSNKVQAWLQNNAEIEALCAKIDAAEPFSLVMNATVRRLTGKLLYLDLTHTEGEEVTAFSLDLQTKDHAELALSVGGVKRLLSVTTAENGWRTFVAHYAYHVVRGEETPESISGTLTLDKKRDAYTLTLGKAEAVKTVSGRFWCRSDAFFLSVDEVKTGDTVTDFAFSLGVKGEGAMPELPQYLSLPKVTEPRIEPVLSRAKEARDAFFAAFDRSAFTAKGVAQYFRTPFSFE